MQAAAQGIRSLIDCGAVTEARALLEPALRIAPHDARLRTDMGDVLFLERRIPEAIEQYTDALRYGAEPARSAVERWMCRMLLGDFATAWHESDATRTLPPLASLRGKRVRVYASHGLGDTIQFVRYLQPLREAGIHVYFDCQPALSPLLGGLHTQPVQFSIEIMDLPYLFRSTVDSIPAASPYIRVPREAVARRRELLVSTARFHVGLVWAGSAWDPRRSIALRELRAILQTPGVVFYSLQMHPESDELRCSKFPIVDSAPQDILDTAGLIANLDLVITIDTMVAHLAGALAKPVWTLLPFAADWRWLLARDDSPWYPSMRLFRQPREGDWQTVVQRVGDALRSAVQA